MILGLTGLGTVGGTLERWLTENTKHTLLRYDPDKGHKDSLEGSEAIFVSVPAANISILEEAVKHAKKFSDTVFIRSTVLPGTNDRLGTIAMPEFLTERTAYEDFCKLPVVCGVGKGHETMQLLANVLPNKQKIFVSNTEAELAKYAHNCFGAMKVTYFNMIHNLCEKLGAEYQSVLAAASHTGFIESEHTQVPGHDGKFGYGGRCFPENVETMYKFLYRNRFDEESKFFEAIKQLNAKYRGKV